MPKITHTFLKTGAGLSCWSFDLMEEFLQNPQVPSFNRVNYLMLISLSEWTLVEMRGGDHPWPLIGPRYLTWPLIGWSSAPGLAVAPVSCCFPITMLIETQCDPGPGPAAIKHDPDKMCSSMLSQSISKSSSLSGP